MTDDVFIQKILKKVKQDETPGSAARLSTFLSQLAELPESQIERNIPYRDDPERDAGKHQLDLFTPEGTDWPTLLFVPGGGWRHGGSKDLQVGPIDTYGNVGRFYAARGVAVAAISYRLQPQVNWREQTADVAAAIAWTHRNIADRGGDPERLYVAGFCSGGHLAAHATLDPRYLEHHDLTPRVVRGVAIIGGSGYDLTDEESVTARKCSYYELRLRLGPDDHDWKHQASCVQLIKPDVPPYLLICHTRDSYEAMRQHQVFHQAFQAAGAKSFLVEAPGEEHLLLGIVISRPGLTTRSILDFVHQGEEFTGLPDHE